MSDALYVVASDEGAAHYGAEVGAELAVDLDESEERAVVAAGWLEKADKKAGDK